MAATASQKTDVSLFPFLSILCALIGVLVLILMALAVGHVESTEADQTVIHDIVLKSLEVKRLTELQVEDKDPEALLARLRDELHRLSEQAAACNPPFAVEPIKVEPFGSGGNRAVRFIECTEYALDIRESGVRVGKLDIPRSRKLREALDRYKSPRKKDFVGLDIDVETPGAAAGDGWDVIFLIRPDGVETFKMAEDVARELEAKYAAIPVPGYAPLDLNMFGADKQ